MIRNVSRSQDNRDPQSASLATTWRLSGQAIFFGGVQATDGGAAIASRPATGYDAPRLRFRDVASISGKFRATLPTGAGISAWAPPSAQPGSGEHFEIAAIPQRTFPVQRINRRLRDLQ
ncbi:hypothetical protein K6W16_05740 [Burkholderia dolosa]|uniref:Uncharacterized protein n=1 Tax=Burkholderia dolosa TaxID=152500 RepID=A0A892IFM3_9BURK|nr:MULTISPECIES: hypothetical protein [Burkholderia]MBR8418252.1 hypothetical protein [Burkholderia dolosa]MBY4656974.1 hypothetical protein [Burkholderia dolosa]MBY4688192.1 hypothetical protein [Burkholderia dolosa]MBY4783525.1 hypothetical protein [Burkholderia dolosa]MBY4786109.1 hypothetical protein [Burkholderia dolosa]